VAGAVTACALFFAVPGTCAAVAALYATKAALEAEMGGAVSDDINKYFNSTFMDVTASKNNLGPYRCEKVKVGILKKMMSSFLFLRIDSG